MYNDRYTDTNLSFKALKGNDRTSTSNILQLCDELELIVYIANLEASIMGQGSFENCPDITDVEEMITSLLKVADMDGRTVAEIMQFNDSNFIQGEQSPHIMAKDQTR